MNAQTIFVIVIFISEAVVAQVNLKNGNFYTSHTDLTINSSTDFEITRTYNSKFTGDGWFGLGWGSDYETFLIPQIDGTILVHENGSGGYTWFKPQNMSIKVNDSLLVKLSEYWFDQDKKRKHGVKLSDYTDKLLSNKERLASVWKTYLNEYKLDLNSLLQDSVFISTTRGVQYLNTSKSGFIRVKNSQKEYFNEEGNLVQISSHSGIIKINYELGSAHSISDNLGNTIFLFYNQSQNIERIISSTGQTCIYHYSEKGELTYSKDVAGNEYLYEYDKMYNLTKVVYGDSTQMEISYDDSTYFTNKIVDRYDDFTLYTYGADSIKPNHHYWTYVSKLSFYGDTVRNKYEYWIEIDPEIKTAYTRKILTIIQGITSETVYNRHGSPLSIVRGNSKTTFAYNDIGLLIEKRDNREIKKIKYKEGINKISEIEQNFIDSDSTATIRYEYNGQNLVLAQNSNDKSVRLEYDSNGQIARMVSDETTLTFKYNNLSKPIEITQENLGSIQISYDDFGEISKIESDEEDTSMALVISRELQKLLSLTEPAGINLNL